jgi:hypothetical protein
MRTKGITKNGKVSVRLTALAVALPLSMLSLLVGVGLWVWIDETRPVMLIKIGPGLNMFTRSPAGPETNVVHPGQTVFIPREMALLRKANGFIDSWFEHQDDRTIFNLIPEDWKEWFSNGENIIITESDRVDSGYKRGRRTVPMLPGGRVPREPGIIFTRSFAIVIPRNLISEQEYVFKLRRIVDGVFNDNVTEFPPIRIRVVDPKELNVIDMQEQ